MLDDIGPDLDEGHAKIEATRAALQAALDAQEGDADAVRAVMREAGDIADF